MIKIRVLYLATAVVIILRTSEESWTKAAEQSLKVHYRKLQTSFQTLACILEVYLHSTATMSTLISTASTICKFRLED